MKTLRILMISITALALTSLLCGLIFSPAASQVLAKHGGGPAAQPGDGAPWLFPNPPGWSMAKHGGTGNSGQWNFPTPPGWSGQMAKHGGTGNSGQWNFPTPPGWSGQMAKHGGTGHSNGFNFIKPPGWSNA